MRLVRSIICSGLMLLVGGLSVGISAEIIPLPGLPLDSSDFSLSGNGQFVTGYFTDSKGTHAFRWSSSDGLTDLTNGAVGSYASARASSYDGSVVVGFSSVAWGVQPFRWEAASGLQTLGSFGGYVSYAENVSLDGRFVVGSSAINSTEYHPFLWDAVNGMRDLGSFGGPYGTAKSVSADGGIVSGRISVGVSSRAFRWTNETGMLELGTLGGLDSTALAMTPDGRVIVGSSSTLDGATHAFRWENGRGMEDLGVLPSLLFAGGTEATSISADGKTIVGYSSDQTFVWDEVNGMTSLTKRLQAQQLDLTGWDEVQVYTLGNAVAGDSSDLTLFGYGRNNGVMMPLLIRHFNSTIAPEPSPLMLTGIAALAVGGYSIWKSRKQSEKPENITVYRPGANESCMNIA